MTKASSNSSQRFVLMARDLDLLQSLSDARYLTIEALEWLHFPQWRERYQAWQAAGATKPFMASASVYRRMRLLVDQKLIRRIVRPAMLAVDNYQREPDLFFLTEKGAHLLAEHRGLDLAELYYGEPRQRSYLMLQHHVAVGQVYAALRSRIDAKPGIAFTHWRSEHHAQKDFDHLTMRVPQPDGTHRTQETGIQPDGAFFIEYDGGRMLFFLEVERDQPLKKWKEKVYAYEAYSRSTAMQARYGTREFVLLGLALDATHQRRLLEATGEAIAGLYTDPLYRKQAQNNYMVAHMGCAHPTRIGAGWQVLQRIEVVERGGIAPLGVKVEIGEHVLIS
ncbi:MAG TPA: replication-relaxation family protein [Herpetosiphonaceae bacterium]